MWKEEPHVYTGGGKKKIVNAIMPRFTPNQWRHKKPLIPTEINKKTAT